MTAQTDLRDATIEVVNPIIVQNTPSVGLTCPEVSALIADAILSLLARWECKEPGDCPE